MPIVTTEDGLKEIRFGTGDIMMNDTYNGTEFPNGLAIKQMEQPREIGTVTDEFSGMDLKQFKPGIHLVFGKKASVRALIESLYEIHDQMPED